MSSILSSTMLRSTPLATSLSSNALSSMQASLALSPAAAVLASTAFHPSAASSSSLASTPSAAFIAPVNAGLMSPRSAVNAKNARGLHHARPPPPPPAFVVTPSTSFLEALPDPNSSDLSSPLDGNANPPPPIPTDPTFIPSTKSLRHALNLSNSEDGSNSPRSRSILPRVVGHRGALYDELENTLEGFLRCAELGCDAVELDVFLLKDQTLVVFHGGGSDEHPGDLHEYCNVHGNILDLTYEQTQQLGFNPNFREFPCPEDKIRHGRIPTLEQVLLGLKPTQTHVKIELKGPGVVEPVLDLVDRLGMVDQCEFSSFDLPRLKQLRDLRPQVDDSGRYLYKSGALFDDCPEDFLAQAVAVGATEVHLRYDQCTIDRVTAIHAAGMDSMAWFRGPIGMKSDVTKKYWDVGNEDERCYQVLLDSGVMQMCVNRPDVLIRMLQQQIQYVTHVEFDSPHVSSSTEMMVDADVTPLPPAIPLHIVEDYESS